MFLFVLIETTTTAFLTYRKVYARPPCPSLWCELFKYKLYVGIVVVDTHIAHNLHIIPSYRNEHIYIYVPTYIVYQTHAQPEEKAHAWKRLYGGCGEQRRAKPERDLLNGKCIIRAHACLCITCGNAVDRNPKYIVYYIYIYMRPLRKHMYDIHIFYTWAPFACLVLLCRIWSRARAKSSARCSGFIGIGTEIARTHLNIRYFGHQVDIIHNLHSMYMFLRSIRLCCRLRRRCFVPTSWKSIANTVNSIRTYYRQMYAQLTRQTQRRREQRWWHKRQNVWHKWSVYPVRMCAAQSNFFNVRAPGFAPAYICWQTIN